MAEFKNVFIKSKMNKDLDDRLLPQGEYRDALNIQVSKSESEDVGALENVLGNSKLINFNEITGNANVVCIGYLVSEVNSCVFFFLTDNTLSSNVNGQYKPLASNFIVRSVISQGVNTQNNVLVKGAFLNFWEGAPIYGVNLLEELLFWTDNRNQPRKINVDFALSSVEYYMIEDTISVAKYMPYASPVLWDESALSPGDYETTMKDVVSEFLPDGTTVNPYEDTTYRGDPDYLEDKFVRFSYRFKFEDGEYSVFAPFTQECFIPKQDGYFLLDSGASTTDENDMSAAYRSTIVDFMENKVNQLTLLIDMPVNGDPAFPTTTLLNVTDYFKISEIEILFKESDGLAVLVADTVSAAQIKAQTSGIIGLPTNTFKYTYSGTKPFRTLPEDQLTRVYDKVPVKALGQEIISNRVVYSNFQTKHTPPTTLNYNVGTQPKQGFDVTTLNDNPVEWRTSIVEYPNHTLKQNRNYQAGFVLSDRFGRTTSTLLSNSGDGVSSGISKLSTVYSPYNDSTVDIGAWPGDALFVQVNETINETPVAPTLYPGTYIGDPTLPNYNPLGFETWKVVVKQQEQDYYNVYLPGILAAYPKEEDKELGLTSHVVLFNDNINKVPRDLAEVGPDQKQFRSSVQLFGRVENTNVALVGGPPATNLGQANKQYYPSRFSDTVSTISNMFDLFNIDPGTVSNDYERDFYESESNPLIGRISTVKQIGQQTPQPASAFSIQNLAIYETEPVESKLDIYWETSTSGTIKDLNAQVDISGGQTIFQIQNFDWYISEYFGVQSAAAWDPAVQGSPEPGNAFVPGPVATLNNGYSGRFRSVISGEDAATGSLNGAFYFEQFDTTPIQDVTLESFTVIDGTGNDVTSNFEILQIYGTSSTIPGPGRYTNYRGLDSLATGYTHDSFIIVNKSHRVFLGDAQTDGTVNGFTVEIVVSDASLPQPAPPKTFTFPNGSNVNDVKLTDLQTIHVGGEQLIGDSVSWGQNSQPILDFVLPQSPPPSTGLFFEYGYEEGLTNLDLVKFYGMNGANSNNNGGIGVAFPNQETLQWSIGFQQKPFVGNDEPSNVNIFEINPNTGALKEITPGQGIGKYYLRILLNSDDSTNEAQLNIAITIGRKTADGSFSNNIRGYELQYDNAYLFNLHNTLGSEGNAGAYDEIDPGITSDIEEGFTYTYPDIGRIYTESPVGLNESFQNTGNGDYAYGSQTEEYQRLNLYQPTDNPDFSGIEGALTQGTGYINIEMFINSAELDPGNNLYQTSEVSWAVEYREITPSVGEWKPATDVEGNVLSWNTALTGAITPVTNPQQSGEKVDGTDDSTTGTSTATHAVRNRNVATDTDQIYGAAYTSAPVTARANSVQYQAEQKKTASSIVTPTLQLGKWVVVGESPNYSTTPCFGEYRVIIQNIGGECSTCQSKISGNPNALGNGMNQAGVINIGDFYYDLKPVNSPRAFAYNVDTSVLFPDTTQGKEDALNNDMSNTEILFAEEGINRYVSQFYEDYDLTIPYTGWTGTGNGYISYTAAETGTSDYNTPYSIATSSPDAEFDLAPVFASENAGTKGATNDTEQYKRLWACRIDTATGLKYAGTSVGRSTEGLG